MIQQEDRMCEAHDKKILHFCLNEACVSQRLVCSSCLGSELHIDHLNDLCDSNTLEQKVKESQNNYDQIIQNINYLIEQLCIHYQELKESIKKKYCVKIQYIKILKNDQLHQYLSEITKSNQQFDSIFQKLKYGVNIYNEQIQSCLQDLQLDTLSYSDIEQTDKESQIQQSQVKNQEEKGFEYYWGKQDYKKALEIVEQKLYENHNDSILCQRKASCLRLLGRYQDSLEWYDRAINLNPKLLYAFDGKGHSLRMLGRYQESIKFHEKALELDQKYQLSYFGKADSLRMLKQYDESITWYNIAISLDPKHKFSIDGKGHSLRMIKKYQESLVCFEETLKIDPNYQQSYFGKADSIRMLGNYQSSLYWYDKALALDPKHKQSLYGKGASLYMLKDYDLAISVLDQALQQQPDDYLSLSVKGACLINQSKFEQAKELINIALQIQPNYEFAKQQLEKCVQGLKQYGKK